MNIHDEKLREKHFHFIPIKKIDGFCSHHYNSFYQYCSNHKRNIYGFFENEEHKDCKLLKKDNEKNELMNAIDKAIKIKNEMQDFQKQINESFEEIKRKIEEIIFFKNFIFSYESQQKCLIFNYNILDNLKAFKSIAKLNEKKFELIYKYSKKLINLLKKGNLKAIIKHTDHIYYIKILVYLNILSNDNIIACCFDGKMRIYELKNDGSKLIKELEGHNDIAIKVIKIKEKLISCSRDKIMEIWEKKK